MERVARRSVLALLLLLAACTGGDAPASPSSTTTSPSPIVGPSSTPTQDPSPSLTPSPTAEPVVLPPGVPPAYARDVEPGDLPFDRLIPDGADLVSTSFPSVDTVIVTWQQGHDIFRLEHGLVVWRRTGAEPPWVATYAFRDPPKAGVLGIQVDTGDVTGDGLGDALVFENTGGSGACGTWSVIALSPAADGPTYTKDLCDATVQISMRPVGIRLIESIYAPTDPHCCPSGVRTSTLQWNGSRWRVTSREETGT